MITRSSPVKLNQIPWNRRLRRKKRVKQRLMRKPVQRLMKLKRRIRRIIQRLKALAYKEVEVYLSIISKTLGRILQDIDDDIRTCCQEVGKFGKPIATLPETFKPHRTVKKIFADRLKMIETTEGVEWAVGEALAFATLLVEGNHVRLNGQDVERGTFSHTHYVLHDQ
ncbi:2-oxoglutarate dehydrogenase, E1 component [Artemisia annua]|uniref:2-oxoglutarate dehydrogenase, E1 component n=1 Tax=Artemisia annua TaxID=35608 RepID=A0A2U1NVE7_ARTAN|nr:2-oxoglutarate dehydrogenase, E1 component [Artemisia annua]